MLWAQPIPPGLPIILPKHAANDADPARKRQRNANPRASPSFQPYQPATTYWLSPSVCQAPDTSDAPPIPHNSPAKPIRATSHSDNIKAGQPSASENVCCGRNDTGQEQGGLGAAELSKGVLIHIWMEGNAEHFQTQITGVGGGACWEGASTG